MLLFSSYHTYVCARWQYDANTIFRVRLCYSRTDGLIKSRFGKSIIRKLETFLRIIPHEISGITLFTYHNEFFPLQIFIFFLLWFIEGAMCMRARVLYSVLLCMRNICILVLFNTVRYVPDWIFLSKYSSTSSEY